MAQSNASPITDEMLDLDESQRISKHEFLFMVSHHIAPEGGALRTQAEYEQKTMALLASYEEAVELHLKEYKAEKRRKMGLM